MEFVFTVVVIRGIVDVDDVVDGRTDVVVDDVVDDVVDGRTVVVVDDVVDDLTVVVVQLIRSLRFIELHAPPIVAGNVLRATVDIGLPFPRTGLLPVTTAVDAGALMPELGRPTPTVNASLPRPLEIELLVTNPSYQTE